MDLFDINLNIPYDLPQERWEQLSLIYPQLPYWKGFLGGVPHWYSCDDNTDGKLIWASVESSGLQIYAQLPQAEWEDWLAQFKEKASSLLGYEIGEPEDGYKFPSYD